MVGTVRMGPDSEPTACVDSAFRVKGVPGVRVADCSVLPVIPNNPTQTTAYLIGSMAGDRLVDEYGLDG